MLTETRLTEPVAIENGSRIFVAFGTLVIKHIYHAWSLRGGLEAPSIDQRGGARAATYNAFASVRTTPAKKVDVTDAT